MVCSSDWLSFCQSSFRKRNKPWNTISMSLNAVNCLKRRRDKPGSVDESRQFHFQMYTQFLYVLDYDPKVPKIGVQPAYQMQYVKFRSEQKHSTLSIPPPALSIHHITTSRYQLDTLMDLELNWSIIVAYHVLAEMLATHDRKAHTVINNGSCRA